MTQVTPRCAHQPANVWASPRSGKRSAIEASIRNCANKSMPPPIVTGLRPLNRCTMAPFLDKK